MDRPKIGVGFRTGLLEVTAATRERKNGYTIWRCRCGCGGERLVDTRTLQRGTVRDCGCVTRVTPGIADLTGMRFGKLVAIAPTSRRLHTSVVWRCLCDCDNVAYVSAKQLQSGYTKSCGCLGHPPLKDFVGKRFGKLTVIAYEEKRAGMHRWRCRCDCGSETVAGQTLLQTGKTKSCGCVQAQVYRENLKLIDGTSVVALEKSKQLRATNTSGYTGVYQEKKSGKWVARITFKGKAYCLGSFADREDAVKARQLGEEMHDDFLRWYYSDYLPAKQHEKRAEAAF